MWEIVAADVRWTYEVRQLSPGGKWYGRKVSKQKGTIVNVGSHVDRAALVREMNRKAGQ